MHIFCNFFLLQNNTFCSVIIFSAGTLFLSIFVQIIYMQSIAFVQNALDSKEELFLALSRWKLKNSSVKHFRLQAILFVQILSPFFGNASFKPVKSACPKLFSHAHAQIAMFNLKWASSMYMFGKLDGKVFAHKSLPSCLHIEMFEQIYCFTSENVCKKIVGLIPKYMKKVLLRIHNVSTTVVALKPEYLNKSLVSHPWLICLSIQIVHTHTKMQRFVKTYIPVDMVVCSIMCCLHNNKGIVASTPKFSFVEHDVPASDHSKEVEAQKR